MSIEWSGIYNQIIDDSRKAGIPVSGFFELTSRCNFQCKMCYLCGKPGEKTFLENELTAEQWISLGREARDAGLLFLTLTGGEIFIRKDFWEIYDALSEMGLNLVLFTNGSLITSEIAERLGKRPPSKVSITIYGANPVTYEKVTGHPEGYEKTIKAIKLLIAEGIKVELKTTVTKYNSDEFEELAKFTRDIGITIGVVNYISPRREGNFTNPIDIRLTSEELVMYEKRILDYNAELNKEKTKTEEISLVLEEDPMLMDNDCEIKKLKEEKVTASPAFRCTAGSCAFWLTWDGKLCPCGLLGEPYSEPVKHGFKKSWQDLQVLCSKIPACEECVDCSYKAVCMTCPARLKAETGSFIIPAQYLCELAKGRKRIGMGH